MKTTNLAETSPDKSTFAALFNLVPEATNTETALMDEKFSSTLGFSQNNNNLFG